MAEMRDGDRSVFSDAYKGTFDFVDNEIARITELAAELRTNSDRRCAATEGKNRAPTHIGVFA